MTARPDCAVDVLEHWTEPARYALKERVRGLSIELSFEYHGRSPYEAAPEAVLAAARDVGGAVKSWNGDAFARVDADGPDADAEHGEDFHRLARRAVEEGAALRSAEQARTWYSAGRSERISTAAHQ